MIAAQGGFGHIRGGLGRQFIDDHHRIFGRGAKQRVVLLDQCQQLPRLGGQLQGRIGRPAGDRGSPGQDQHLFAADRKGGFGR